MKRKFWEILFILISALCLCFGLAACDFGGGEKNTGNSGTQTEQGGNTQKPDEGEQGGSTQKPDEGEQGGSTQKPNETEQPDGVYYLVDENKYDMQTYFTLKDGKWTDENGETGNYEIDDEEVTFFVDFYGQRMEYAYGTVKDGVLTLQYSADGELRTFAKEGAAHLHEYGEWITQTPSTCTKQGTEVLICKTCGKYKSRPLPLESHSYGEWQEMSLPTCTVAGKTKRVCTVCSHEEWGETEALGHEYTVENECIRCGKTWQFTKELDYTFDEESGTYTVSGIGSARGNVVLPYGYGGKWVTAIGDRAFWNCSGLTSITIPNSVTTIGNYAFYYCSGLTEITIPDSVTSIGDSAFYNCSGLTGNLKIPDSVAVIGSGAFSGCIGLTSITLPDSVTVIDIGAFSGCSGLTSITLPDSVTVIDIGAFSGCSGLTGELKIPDSVTSIGDDVFSGCSGLTSVTIGRGVTSIGDSAFSFCSGLREIKMDENNRIYHVEGNCLIDTKNKTLILGCKTSQIPNDGSVTLIGSYAFWGCSGLTEITIPDSVTSIGNRAFGYCIGLTEITIPDSVTSIGDLGAFEGCSGLTSVTIGNGVTSIGSYAFWGCSGLTEITIPDSVTVIGDYAFGECSELEKIYFEKTNGWNILEWNILDNILDMLGSIVDTELDDPKTAAKYLRETSSNGGYADYWWVRYD